MKMVEFPVPYIPGDTSGAFKKPSLSKEESTMLGVELAKALIKNEKVDSGSPVLFAPFYLALVKWSQRHSDDLSAVYKILVKKAGSNLPTPPDLSRFNEHDFANVHRAAWLAIVRSLCRLVGFSPFYNETKTPPDQWADPDPGSVSRTKDLETKHGVFFFDVPNVSGFYAITNGDADDYEGTFLKLPVPPTAVPAPPPTPAA